MEKTLGLYLHIPFCKSKCRYCDFCSFPHRDAETTEAYCRALESEIAEYGRTFCAYTVNTVYFGGGTPTFLPAGRLAALLDAVRTHFSLSEDTEITTECNPATVDAAGLALLRNAGFNRLSIGAQSLDDGELRLLGRIHSADDFRATFAAARQAGFSNISADLMFGIPAQTQESFARTLREICELAPEHISVYGLQIEEGTPFAAMRGELPLPDEDTERAMYTDAVSYLAAHGYAHYEISNFARPGRESRHNLRYWKRQDYLGMGLSSCSCLGNERFSDTDDMARYLAGEHRGTRETVSRHDCLCEAVMLEMRLASGCDFDALTDAFGKDAERYRDALAVYEKDGFVRKTATGYAFTIAGMSVSNRILSDILDFEA